MNERAGRLLVVDDEEINRLMLSAMLTRLGHGVVLASSGEEAMTLIGAEPFDLALLDVLMEGLGGLETLARVRAIRSRLELPVIMVTANHATKDIVQAFELGANDYVTKPVDLAVLGARVQTQLEMQQLGRLKEEFLAMASHDLKNPLCTVGLAAGLLDDTVSSGGAMTKSMISILRNIRKDVRRMQSMVEDFVDGQALREGRLELSCTPTDFNKLATAASSGHADAAAVKHIEIGLDLDTALEPILADERRVVQLIDNLLGNAIKFSASKCPVTLRTSAEERGALFEVCDSGPGLTDADMKGLFVRYAKLSNRPTGTEKSSGLGLAICKQLVDLHHGQIGARNNPDGGSTFWFSLPSGDSSRTGV